MTLINDRTDAIYVESLTMGYGDTVVLKDVAFSVKRGSIFIVMGGSGCGKSTLLKHLIGLKEPLAGSVFLSGVDYWNADEATQLSVLRKQGVLFQGGALWSTLTLLENVALPLKEFTTLSQADCNALARLKLALVGLVGFEDAYPANISGGMKKRAGLARAMALDPDILFFDEPSAGLDPVTSRNLDDLILKIRDSLGTTVVIVTHELSSIFNIGEDAIFLDSQTKTLLAQASPKTLAQSGPQSVRAFLTRI
ncbi:MAG: polyamine ABC transporter ATP-binding protein [Verrucomicrobia bacterium GWF2_51_19]|nr:MAG: polyamine ABC transporter ATP-binding protein [Verrucomicrobia bacterium GWF2_51_19]HCJ11596.1 polyamine ABC transporter ATP-binding protein [Opitutae bacterium]